MFVCISQGADKARVGDWTALGLINNRKVVSLSTCRTDKSSTYRSFSLGLHHHPHVKLESHETNVGDETPGRKVFADPTWA